MTAIPLSKLLHLYKIMTQKIFNTFFIAILTFTVSGCTFQRPDYLKFVSSTELNTIIQNEDIFLVDVHTPQQQHIKGTDLFIPYNQIEKYQNKFPVDKSTPIYLYCKGGPMGNSAAKSLHNLGYNNLFNLEGGANAWQNAGFSFE